MVIVAGYLLVDPADRARYLAGCAEVVRQGRRATGCLDFALSPDAVDPGRVNIFELWESSAAVETFRAGGPSDEQRVSGMSASVVEYAVHAARELFS